ncbi:MAG TPA: response regulator transcription factor [Ktedonobacterales bacterium]|nr:response regulator transcription factor [Ktedonobacterales bacterium]
MSSPVPAPQMPPPTEQPQQLVRVMVVDDQPIVRSGIQFALLDTQDIEVVAMVGSGEEAIDACIRLHPDVVLMDLLMPGMGGMDAIAALHAHAPETHVVALTSFQEGHLVEEALRAGATGYLLKDVGVEELAKAIRLAQRGIPTLAPAAAQALVHAVASRPPKIGQDLTQREREVLALLTAGLTNQQIAERLVITSATVKFHTRSIRSKLGTSSRTETAVLAMRHHLVPSE